MKYINYIDTERMYKVIDICTVFSLKTDCIIGTVYQNSIEHMYDSSKDIYITRKGLSQLIDILIDRYTSITNLHTLTEFSNLLNRNALNEDEIDKKKHHVILNM